MLFSIIKDSVAWRDAISHFEHDFYHTWDFHILSEKNGEGSPVLFKLENNGETIVFPLLARGIPESELKDLISVYGYPGPLFSTTSLDAQNILLKKLFEQLEQLNYVSLFSRLHPILNCHSIEHSIQLGDIAYFNLNDSLEDIYSMMRKDHRRDIRKLKNSEFIIKQHDQPTDEQIIEFKNIYDLTMNKLAASEHYYFSTDYYSEMFNSKDYKASLFTVYSMENAIASAIMIQTKGICQYHLSGTLPEFYKKNPMKLILGSTLETMHSLNLKHFILGGGVGSARDSLFDFKYGFTRKATPFSIMKKIFNPTIYKTLTEKRFSALDLDIKNSEEINYFPLYRYSK